MRTLDPTPLGERAAALAAKVADGRKSLAKKHFVNGQAGVENPMDNKPIRPLGAL